MLRRWSVARLRAELGALEASAERAGIALARVSSWSDMLVVDEIRARRAIAAWMPSRARTWIASLAPGMIDSMRVVIAVTALAAFLALVVASALAI
jgi:hypothetical protein